MKYIIALLISLKFLTAMAHSEEPKPQTKIICVNIQDSNGKPIIDPKTSKPKQDCRQVIKHQKHQSTKIEDAKKEEKNK